MKTTLFDRTSGWYTNALGRKPEWHCLDQPSAIVNTFETHTYRPLIVQDINLDVPVVLISG
jgi:hypothetical protein